MKTKITLVAMLLTSISFGARAQSSLLNNLLSSDVVNEVVNTVTGGTSVTVANMTGTWTYANPAVELVGDNALENIAGTAATSQVETKLSETFTKVGISAGTFSFTFNSDSSFSCTLKSKTLSGTYTVDTTNSQATLKFSAVSSVNLGSLTANVSIDLSSMSLLFEADKLLSLISTLSSVTDNSTIQTLNTLVSSYSGLMLGFELDK